MYLSRLPNTLLICTNSIASIHTKTNTITKHVHICSLRQIYDYLNPASGFIWPYHWSQLTTSEMDSCCWEPEFPAITEPSHPFTCRSMGQLLKWSLEQCVIHWCFNPLHRALAPLSYHGHPISPQLFVWEMDSETRLWPRPVSHIKVWWRCREGVCWLVFFTASLWLTGRTETKVALWISNGSAWALPSSHLIKWNHIE